MCDQYDTCARSGAETPAAKAYTDDLWYLLYEIAKRAQCANRHAPNENVDPNDNKCTRHRHVHLYIHGIGVAYSCKSRLCDCEASSERSTMCTNCGIDLRSLTTPKPDYISTRVELEEWRLEVERSDAEYGCLYFGFCSLTISYQAYHPGPGTRHARSSCKIFPSSAFILMGHDRMAFHLPTSISLLRPPTANDNDSMSMRATPAVVHYGRRAYSRRLTPSRGK